MTGHEVCVVCEKKTPGKLAQCSLCEGWLHFKCMKLPDGAEEFLQTAFCLVTCKKCHQKTLDFIALQKVLSSDLQALTNHVVAMRKDVTDLQQLTQSVVTSAKDEISKSISLTSSTAVADFRKSWADVVTSAKEEFSKTVSQNSTTAAEEFRK